MSAMLWQLSDGIFAHRFPISGNCNGGNCVGGNQVSLNHVSVNCVGETALLVYNKVYFHHVASEIECQKETK